MWRAGSITNRLAFSQPHGCTFGHLGWYRCDTRFLNQCLIAQSNLQPIWRRSFTEEGRGRAIEDSAIAEHQSTNISASEKRPRGRPRKQGGLSTSVEGSKAGGRPGKQETIGNAECQGPVGSLRNDKSKSIVVDQKIHKLREAQNAETTESSDVATYGDSATKTKDTAITLQSEHIVVPRRGRLTKSKNKPGLVDNVVEGQHTFDKAKFATFYEELGPHAKRRYSKRIDIVSNGLSNDIVDRLKPTLEKHIGCDIIDLNPGVGVFSAALHEHLKPRTHILMEQDHKLYKPLLQPLLDKDSTYKFVPKNGIIWDNLEKIEEYLTHQTKLDRNDPRLDEPNNTLLLVANIGFDPTRIYKGFSSIAQLVVHQLLSASRTHTLIHKYGLVRMLVWVSDKERHKLLPRSITGRIKSTVQYEICCRSITEVASSGNLVWRRGDRVHAIDLEVTATSLQKMKSAGLSTPPGRECPWELEVTRNARPISSDDSPYTKTYLIELEDMERRFATGEFSKYVDSHILPVPPPNDSEFFTPEWKLLCRYRAEVNQVRQRGYVWETRSSAKKLEMLEEGFASGKFSRYTIPETELPRRLLQDSLRDAPKGHSDKYGIWTPQYSRLQRLRQNLSTHKIRRERYGKLAREYEKIVALQIASLQPSATDFTKQELALRTQEWKDRIKSYHPDEQKRALRNTDDELAYFRGKDPILTWDNRRAEPVKTYPDEFNPARSIALLDFQPNAIWPILRGELYEQNWAHLKHIQEHMYVSVSNTLTKACKNLAPGALEWFLAECPSLTDPSKGGNLDPELLTVRRLTVEMWEEILEAWLRWPNRPPIAEIFTGVATYESLEENETFASTQKRKERIASFKDRQGFEDHLQLTDLDGEEEDDRDDDDE
ncbi:hypothetical protein B0O99DRAFT_630311 [Bisporella sp. PMI_857]|nr:hypothetical protein B0O99DRAFT_630311 [Bisporella sp. PMI_857]